MCKLQTPRFAFAGVVEGHHDVVIPVFPSPLRIVHNVLACFLNQLSVCRKPGDTLRTLTSLDSADNISCSFGCQSEGFFEEEHPLQESLELCSAVLGDVLESH